MYVKIDETELKFCEKFYKITETSDETLEKLVSMECLVKYFL